MINKKTAVNVCNFLIILNRPFFAQHGKITEISNFLTGKSSGSFNQSKASPSSDDFSFEDNFSGGNSAPAEATSSATEEEDDFFSDL